MDKVSILFQYISSVSKFFSKFIPTTRVTHQTFTFLNGLFNNTIIEIHIFKVKLNKRAKINNNCDVICVISDKNRVIRDTAIIICGFLSELSLAVDYTFCSAFLSLIQYNINTKQSFKYTECFFL